MTDDPSPRTRKPAGAAVMQPQVTAAIRTAAFEELADVGYGKLSMEAVARRAGVSKPTLYRRWPGKEQLVLSLVAEVAVDAADTPDTGSLRGDIRAFLEAAAAGLTHPLASRIIPDLLAQAMRTPALAVALQTGVGEGRRVKVVALLERAIDRGELPAEVNLELALDFLLAPLFWRALRGGDPTTPEYLDELTDMLLAALEATPQT
ncbi:TetR/AcrR family transcriptional regulator [Nocardia sp. NBC_01388]|uniref:TetR/AcrR family transcriptional regulator n=1 Tax=Nocardia sp. NBC_01388 TaxID=2903596 RepID=UPI00324344E5